MPSDILAENPGRPLFRTGVRAAWTFHELLRQLVVRNLKVRYQRSVLGFLWALLNPLATIAILVMVFSQIIRIGVPSYWAFLVSGYFAWVFFLHTVGTSAAIINDHAYLARSASFPTEILVFAAAGSRLIEFVLELALVVAVLAIFHHGALPSSFLLLPLLVAIQCALTLGLALPTAAMSVFFHDIEHALPVGLTMLAYLSPVYYPVALVPEALRTIYLFNPIAVVLTLYHRVLYEGAWPSAAHLGAAALIATTVYLLGYAAFRYHRAFIPETV